MKNKIKEIAKKELIELFGELGVIELENHGVDFLVILGGTLIKIVKVKEYSKKVDSVPSESDLRAYKDIIDFSKNNHLPAELWIYYKEKDKYKKLVRVL